MHFAALDIFFFLSSSSSSLHFHSKRTQSVLKHLLTFCFSFCTIQCTSGMTHRTLVSRFFQLLFFSFRAADFCKCVCVCIGVCSSVYICVIFFSSYAILFKGIKFLQKRVYFLMSTMLD